MVFYNNFSESKVDLPDIEIIYESIEAIVDKYPSKELIGNFDFVDNFGENNKVLFPSGQAVAEIVNNYYDSLKENIGQKIEPYYLTSVQARKWLRNK